MTLRVLQWNDLCILGDRRTPPEQRVITLAGLPARLVPSRGTDCGFYIRSEGPLAQYGDHKWQLRTESDLRLLRELVDAGQAIADDDSDEHRAAEWGRLLADTSRGCFVSGCIRTDIDPRGPVIDDDNRMHKACAVHWEGIYGVLGEDDRADDDVREGTAS